MSELPEKNKAPPPATIMVVEPDILVRTVIADYLRYCGYKVIEGVSGEDVFTVLGAGDKIDIVFADVHLSGDGFALARRIRDTYSTIDVILTAGADSAVAKAGDLCDDGPVGKPYHPRDVLTRIQRLREKRRTFQNEDSVDGGPSVGEGLQFPKKPRAAS